MERGSLSRKTETLDDDQEDERRDDAKGRTRDKKMKKETAERKEKADPPEQKLKCYYVMLTQAIHCVQLINDESKKIRRDEPLCLRMQHEENQKAKHTHTLVRNDSCTSNESKREKTTRDARECM